MMNRPTPLLLFRRWTFAALCSAFLCLFLSSCRSPPAPDPLAKQPCIRFLLTFDDGPSTRKPYNPTLAIINQLATNDVQPGIKAIFFVQTENRRGGGTPEGREIMRYAHEQGHVIGIHSVSPEGHIAHTTLPTEVLIHELQQAQDLIRRITGSPPRFVRPPYGTFNLRTRTIYANLGLDVLMADVSARDGIIYGFKTSPWRRTHMFNSMKKLRRTVNPDIISTVIVNFHDVNPYTARHMTEYLHILVEEARHAGFSVPKRPFIDRTDALADVAICRRVQAPPKPGPTT
jgi:peptidoglycan/xylan/chitin deacetylase (PgdA/CDA1 family)